MDEIAWQYLFVVYRFDSDQWRKSSEPDINSFVTIKEVLPSIESAEREVARLRELNRDKGAEYHYQRARYYDDGRIINQG